MESSSEAVLGDGAIRRRGDRGRVSAGLSEKKMLKLHFLLLATCLLSLSSSSAAEFDWDSIPSGEWIVVPTLGEAAPKVFHGGASIAPDRDAVFFFGSDTHSPTALEKGESNALWRLDLNSLKW